MSVNLYGPSGPGTDILQLILDLTAAVKSIQGGFFIAPGAVTDEKVAANASIAQSKIADLVADLAARATDAELTAEAGLRAAGDTAQAASVTAHLADTVDAHDASAVSVVPAGALAATNAQAALVELDADITAEATARATGDNSRLPLAGGTLTGPLVLAGDAASALQAVPRQQLDAAVASGVPDATPTVKGKVQLAGDLAGTAALPTVPGLANKADAAATTTALNAKLALAGGTMTGAIVLAADPTANLQAATKQYVDTGVASATIPDATAAVKGKLQLAGDLGGTAALPTVPGLAARALDAAVVHNTGAESIAGVKTFSAAPVLPAGALPESAVANLTTDLAAKLPLAGGTLTGALVLAANAAAALQAVPKQQLDSGLALKADDNAVVKLTGDQTKTARLTMRSVGVEPVAADNGAFALKGRHWTGIVGAVPYVVPTGPGADQLVALDLVVKGTPVNTPDLGVAWIDICDSNEAEVDADDYQATRIGKTRDGYGYVTVAEGDGANGSNPNAIPLVLQHMGGGVGIGAGAKAPAARLHVSGDTLLATAAAGNVPLTLKGAASQTADLLRIQDSAAADLIRVNPAGRQLIGSSTMLGVTTGVVDAMLVVNQPNPAIQTQIWRGSARGDGFAYTARISDGAHFTTNGAITSNGASDILLPAQVRQSQPVQYMFAAGCDLSFGIDNADYVSDTVGGAGADGVAHFNGFIKGGGLHPYFTIRHDGELRWGDGAISTGFTSMRRDSNGGFVFAPNGVDKVAFKYSGEVGIGALFPTHKLTVDGSGTQIRIRSDPNRYYGEFGISSTGMLFTAFDDTGGVFMPYIVQASQTQWRVGYVEKMRLSVDGDIGLGTNDPLASFHVKARDIFRPAIIARAVASQWDPIQKWENSSGVVLAKLDKGGRFGTLANAAPADGEIVANECWWWFDPTNGAAKVMFKAKQADGTVRSGSLALA